MTPTTVRRVLRLIPCLVILIACAREGTAAAKGRGDLWREHEAGESAPGVTPVQLPSLAPLVKQLKPAVVNIYTTQVIRANQSGFQRGPFNEEDPSEQFWHHFMGPQQERKQNSLGSGFIINSHGDVVTNNHVVEKATEIKIKLADGREFPGEVVGRDPKTDVALLRMKSDGHLKDLPSVYLGDSDKLDVGDFVVAIGNPFGLSHSVSLGIVSAKERVVEGGPYDDFIQTDAAINPGNSGGPMFNLKGEVVGVNTAIIGQGIGFAVPINLVKEVLPALESKGVMSRGWLGVGVQEVTPELAKTFKLDRPAGALIREVFAESPADKAGLKAGDVVVSVNGRDVQTYNQLARFIAVVSPNETASLVVLREGKEKKVSVRVGERAEDERQLAMRNPEESPGGQVPTSSDRLGISVQPVTPELARRFEISRRDGLVVVDVNSDSPAAAAGVTPGSVILEVNRSPVRSIADYQRAIASAHAGDLVLLRLQRENAAIYVAVRLPA
jgi:serine protease Do